MIIQRKRVAKRLASGLLAGALALGGLAISGSSVSARTPISLSTDRLSGDDRYETAVEIARNSFGTPSGGIVIVSGEKEADALAAAPLAGTTMPILLVKKDSLPASVADYLDDVKSTIKNTNPYKIYVVGGTSVVSTDVEDAIKSIVTPGDATPASIVRYSGDDRYATALDLAKRHAGLMDNLDRLVIVNGTGWADAMSVAPIAAKNGWPIALTGNGGLNETAKAFIDAYMAVPGSAKKFLLVGGSSVLPSSVEEYLVGTKLVSVANIDRRGGADRYDTNLALQVYALPTAKLGYNNSPTFSGKFVAIASGTSPWDALSASSWAAKGDSTDSYHVLLSNPVAPSSNVTAVAGLIADLTKGTANSWPNKLFMLGGKSAVSDTVKAGFIAGAQSTDIPAPVIGGCVDGAGQISAGVLDGSKKVTLTFSKKLTSAEQNEFTSKNASVTASLKLNGVKQSSTSFIDAISFDASGKVATLDLTAGLDPADTLDFAGVVEGTAGAHTWTRSIGAATQCVVPLDSAAPSVTLKAVAASDGDLDHILVTSNEALDKTALITAANWTIGSTTVTGNFTATAVDATGTGYKLTNANSKVTATQVVTLAAAGIKDRADTANTSAGSAAATAASDASAPTLTLLGKACVAGAQATNAVAAGGLTFSANALTAVDGTAGNGYAISVVNSRGLLIPSISVDDTAKTITVVADTGYHTIADVKKVAENTGVDGNWTVGGTDANKPTATLVASVTASGADTCTLTLAGSEPFALSSGQATAGGVPGSGTIAATTIVNDTTSGEASVVAVTISATQAGAIVYQATVTDIAGNSFTRVVSA